MRARRGGCLINNICPSERSEESVFALRNNGFIRSLYSLRMTLIIRQIVCCVPIGDG